MKTLYGFTAVELLITMVVFSILAVLAVPAFSNLFEKHRLIALAESVYSDLVDARVEAVQTDKTIYFSIDNGSQWCYGLNDAQTDCNCSQAEACTIDGISRTVSYLLYKNTIMTTTIAGTTTTSGITSNAFESMRGLPLFSSEITLSNTQGQSISVRIRPTGRIYICSDHFNQFQSCS